MSTNVTRARVWMEEHVWTWKADLNVSVHTITLEHFATNVSYVRLQILQSHHLSAQNAIKFCPTMWRLVTRSLRKRAVEFWISVRYRGPRSIFSSSLFSICKFTTRPGTRAILKELYIDSARLARPRHIFGNKTSYFEKAMKYSLFKQRKVIGHFCKPSSLQ